MCIWQNADFRSNSAGLGAAGNSTQNLSCSEYLKILKTIISHCFSALSCSSGDLTAEAAGGKPIQDSLMYSG